MKVILTKNEYLRNLRQRNDHYNISFFHDRGAVYHKTHKVFCHFKPTRKTVVEKMSTK